MQCVYYMAINGIQREFFISDNSIVKDLTNYISDITGWGDRLDFKVIYNGKILHPYQKLFIYENKLLKVIGFVYED